MKLDLITLQNFQCFGPHNQTLTLANDVTTLIGANGAGKTAAFQAISRMFGLGSKNRTVVKTDFHLPSADAELADGSELRVEAVFSFPELTENVGSPAVAEFFKQMSASEPGDDLKIRIVMTATWVDDGTPDGVIDTAMRWVYTLDDPYDWDKCKPVSASQRNAIQVVYVPANRGSVSQVKALLRGRLWRAAKWSDTLKTSAASQAADLQTTFTAEAPICYIQERLDRRWEQVDAAGTQTKPVLKLTEDKFEAIIRNTDVKFTPEGDGAERDLERLSDGQKSLFQIALTAATLEIEHEALALSDDASPFDAAHLRNVPLTLLLIEEPENSLAAFYLSRIMDLCRDIGAMEAAQVMLSSHSASILSRTKPEDLRHFRLNTETGESHLRSLTLPASKSEEGKYVRQAVRAYPELYFAKLVVLGEGDSEQIVLPKLAEARGLHLDQAFCPIVPLGGRHVQHFWTLLRDLGIPHLTLLDLDYGRQHGGAKAIKAIVQKLDGFGVSFDACEHIKDGRISLADVDDLEDTDIDPNATDTETEYLADYWLETLRELSVFFSEPLDIDFSMLLEFQAAYAHPNPGGTGPSKKAESIEKAKKTSLKKKGFPTHYDESWDKYFQWYPYLFLSKSKPAAHLSALNRLKKKELKTSAPYELDLLLDAIENELG